MAVNQLILVPMEPAASVDPLQLQQTLRAIEFIAAPMPQGEPHFQPGENFLQLVTFLGCSPVVSLGVAGATAEICHVELPAPSARTMALSGKNLKSPRCPHCRHTLSEAVALMREWNEAAQDLRLPCPGCGKELDITTLNWRQSAGFARSLVRIWGIFEGEAVPSDELMATLKHVSGLDWAYFYLSL